MLAEHMSVGLRRHKCSLAELAHNRLQLSLEPLTLNNLSELLMICHQKPQDNKIN